MDRLSTLLRKTLNRRGLTEQASASLIVHQAQEWLEVHLPDTAPYLTVERFRDRTLTISCGHSVAAQECRMRLSDLKTYLSGTCGHTTLEEIALLRGLPVSESQQADEGADTPSSVGG